MSLHCLVEPSYEYRCDDPNCNVTALDSGKRIDGWIRITIEESYLPAYQIDLCPSCAAKRLDGLLRSVEPIGRSS